VVIIVAREIAIINQKRGPPEITAVTVSTLHTKFKIPISSGEYLLKVMILNNVFPNLDKLNNF
jgi:hypothetical protein